MRCSDIPTSVCRSARLELDLTSSGDESQVVLKAFKSPFCLKQMKDFAEKCATQQLQLVKAH